VAASVQRNEASIAEYEALGAVRQVLFVQNNLADCLLQLGTYARAAEVLGAVVPVAESMALDAVTGIARLNLCLALGQLGQTDEAVACADEAMRLLVAIGNRRYYADGHTYRAIALAVGERLDLAAVSAEPAPGDRRPRRRRAPPWQPRRGASTLATSARPARDAGQQRSRAAQRRLARRPSECRDPPAGRRVVRLS